MSVQTKELKTPVRLKGRRFFAWLLMSIGVLSLLTLAACVFAPYEPNDEGRNAAIAFFLIMTIFCLGWAILLFRTTGRKELKDRSFFQEKVVLKIAANNGGNVTIAQIVCDTPLSHDEVEETLSRLCGENIAQPDLLDDGTVLYRFSGLLRHSEESSM